MNPVDRIVDLLKRCGEADAVLPPAALFYTPSELAGVAAAAKSREKPAVKRRSGKTPLLD